jgi:hypothetical protein
MQFATRISPRGNRLNFGGNNMHEICIKHTACRNYITKGKFLTEITREKTFPKCMMQSDLRYIIERGEMHSLQISSPYESTSIGFFPQLIKEWGIFPVYFLIEWPPSWIPFGDFVNRIKNKGIKYTVCMISILSDNNDKYSILIKIDDGKYLKGLFEDYLFHIATLNHFIGIWLGEIPCFSWYKGIQYDNYDHEPNVLVCFNKYFVTFNWDADYVILLSRDYHLNYNELQRRLRNFYVKEYTEDVYECC